MALIVMAAVWKQISYNFLFFLAGLQSIPKSLIEAAAIDGAGPGRRFWTIVFPLLSPTTFFLLVINIVYAFFDTFAIVDAATQGGPGKETSILVYKVYYDGFKALDLGGSAAQSVVLMVIVIALTVLQFRFVEQRGELLMMVERRRWLDVLSHLVLILGRRGRRLPGLPHLRRLDADRRGGRAAPMSLLPGDQLVENYRKVLFRRRRCRLARAGRPHDVGQPGHGASASPSARSSSRCCRPLRSSTSASPSQLLLLDDLRHADAAGGGAHRADLPGDVRPRAAQHLCRADRAADRLGHGDLPVPPVLPDRARRTGRGRAHRRRRPDALLLGRAGAAVGHQRSRRCS